MSKINLIGQSLPTYKKVQIAELDKGDVFIYYNKPLQLYMKVSSDHPNGYSIVSLKTGNKELIFDNVTVIPCRAELKFYPEEQM